MLSVTKLNMPVKMDQKKKKCHKRYAADKNTSQTVPGNPNTLAGNYYVRNPCGFCVLETQQREYQLEATSESGSWRFAVIRRVCGSIPSGVIKGMKKYCGKMFPSNSCIVCASFITSPLHSSLRSLT